jgi:hypothetical protein
VIRVTNTGDGDAGALGKYRSRQRSRIRQTARPLRPNALFLVLNSDESKERLRLSHTYAAMTDGELLKLASNPESLTDAAWEALEDELDRRHLELPAAPADRRPQIDFRQLPVIRQFRDLPEALLAKGSLESAGIQCFLRDENLVRLDWFISNFVGGVKLCVNPEDAENAQRLLDEPILEGMYVHGVGLYEQPRCPNCQSLDVNFEELDRPIAYLSAFLRVPMPIQRKGWRCHACNAEWEDEGRQDSGS